AILAAVDGPVIDLGCGPGRLVLSLARRRVPALGVDTSPSAVALARSRGAAALQRDLFGPLPGEGRWGTAPLFDGNVGIGGAPAAGRACTTDADRRLARGRYASPLRDERLAAWLGAALGVLFGVCFLTGLYSHLQQHPQSWFPIPARPAGLYRFTQGLHVASGI